MYRKVFQVFIICTLISGGLYAQNGKQITNQHLIWYRFYNHLAFAKHWEWGLEIDERRFMHPDAQHQLVIRNQLIHTFANGWSAGAGFTYFLQTLPQDPNMADTYLRPELRPHQEVKFKHKLNEIITVTHRYRLEERFFKRMDEQGNHLDGHDFNFRFRYQLQAEMSLIRKDIRKGALGMKVFDEIHLNFGKQIVHNTFDQNRIGGSFIYGLTKNIDLEGGYMNWFQQRSSGSAYFNRDIFRFTLHHYVSI